MRVVLGGTPCLLGGLLTLYTLATVASAACAGRVLATPACAKCICSNTSLKWCHIGCARAARSVHGPLC